MKIMEHKINNYNLKLISTNKFKTVSIKIYFKSNLEYDDIASYNLLSRLLVTRNNNFKTIDSFQSHLENNYGMNIYSSYYNRGNIGIFTVSCLSINSKFAMNEDLLKKQVEVLKECLFNPLFDEKVLEEVKSHYIELLKEKLNRKAYILNRKVNHLLGENTPYGVNIDGDIESIKNVSLDKLKSVYQKLIDSEATIYVVGDLKYRDIEKEFKILNLKSDYKTSLNLDYLKDIDNYDKQVFTSNYNQSIIDLVYQCDITYNHQLFYASKVFLEMFNYQLFHIIREEYNYCYYIYALSNNYLNIMEIVSEIKEKNLDHIIELIQNILVSYTSSFDMNLFRLCKDKILMAIKTAFDTPSNLIETEFGFDFNNKCRSLKELINVYSSVNKEEIIEVSKMTSLKLVSILKEAVTNE